MSTNTATPPTPSVRRRVLPPEGRHQYAHGVATDGSDIRRFRADDELWEAYTAVVGERRRSADIRAYLEWRVENPDTPLPGRWRGPSRTRMRAKKS